MFKFGLVGCGRIAKRHSEELGYGRIEDACLAAICDIVPQRARELGERFGIPYYTDMDEMMSKEEVDVVSVLTESGHHAEHVIRLSKYGKHIVVEKPMALTLDDADRMIAACHTNECRLFVVKQNRFNLPVMKLKSALDEGRLGKLFLGTVRVRWCRDQSYYDQASWRGTWAMDGGVLTNQASHHIDLLQCMLGSVESVQAKGLAAIADIEAEDTAVVILKFVSGALGVIEATTAIRPTDLEGSLSILGDMGSVEIGGFAVNKILHWNFRERLDEDEDVIEKYSVNLPNVYGFGHRAYYESVVKSIRENSDHSVDGIQGRKVVELISAIYESIETKKEIFLPFKPQFCKLGNSV